MVSVHWRHWRWLVALSVTVMGVAIFGRATAAPRLQAPAQSAACRWTKLANGESRTQLSLIGLPGKGVLAFGGADIRPDRAEVKDDLHLLDLTGSATGVWSELSPTGVSPDDRAEHTAVFVPGTDGAQLMLMYGGTDIAPTSGAYLAWPSTGSVDGRPGLVGPAAAGPATVQKDTFRLDIGGAAGHEWTRATTTGQPRTDHSAVWTGDAMVTFGGRRAEAASSAENTAYQLTLPAGGPVWEPFRGSGTAPSKRFAHTAVYDAASKRMIVFGGTNDWSSGLSDTYALELANGWDNAQWVKLSPAGQAPAGRYDHGAVYLPDLRWMVVFGGTSNGRTQLNDVSALDLTVDPPRWLRPAITGSQPADVQGMGAAYSGAAGYAVFYGGHTGSGTSRASKREAWGLTCESGAPTATATVTPGTPVPTTPAPVTATATATPGGDITVTGLVYDTAGGTTAPIAGATVAVGVSVPRQPFTATTGADGRYSLLVPGMYAELADRIEAAATGYTTVTQAVTGPELRANPVRDFALTRSAPTVTPTEASSPTPEPTMTPSPSPTPVSYRVFAPITIKDEAFPGR